MCLLWEEEYRSIQEQLKVSDTNIRKLHDHAEIFKAGNNKFHLENWKKLINNKYIISIYIPTNNLLVTQILDILEIKQKYKIWIKRLKNF